MEDFYSGGCFFSVSPTFCLICPPITPTFELQNLLYSYKNFDYTGWDLQDYLEGKLLKYLWIEFFWKKLSSSTLIRLEIMIFKISLHNLFWHLLRVSSKLPVSVTYSNLYLYLKSANLMVFDFGIMVVVNTKWEDSLLPGLKYCGSCC